MKTLANKCWTNTGEMLEAFERVLTCDAFSPLTTLVLFSKLLYTVLKGIRFL